MVTSGLKISSYMYVCNCNIQIAFVILLNFIGLLWNLISSFVSFFIVNNLANVSKFSATRQEEIPTVSSGVPNTTIPVTSEPWSSHPVLSQITISGAKDMRPGYNDRKYKKL